jgi:hypothetical protein
MSQDALFRNQSLNARRKTAAVSLCASLIEARRRLVLSQSMHSWTLLVPFLISPNSPTPHFHRLSLRCFFLINIRCRVVTAGQFRDIQQRMSAMALQVNPAFAPELLNGAQHWCAHNQDFSAFFSMPHNPGVLLLSLTSTSRASSRDISVNK